MARKTFSTRKMAIISITVSMSFILSRIVIFRMPQGGSISLEAVPIFLIALIFGARTGIISGTLLGCLKAMFGGFIVHPAQFLLDYPIAYAALGVAGFFKGKNKALNAIGVILAFLLRLFAHVLSGVIFFSSYAPKDKNVWLYSFSYNASFLVPEFILTFIVLSMVYDRFASFFQTRYQECR